MNELLFKGCQEGDLEQVKAALASGVSPNVRDAENWMPLHYAAENGFEEIINLLLEAGANVNALNSAGFTPFQILMICEHYSPIVVSKLIAAGAQVGSPLHKAILLNDMEEVRQLLLRHSDVNSTDGLGNTPLHIAVAVNNIEIIQPLLDAGARVDAQDMYDTTPLCEACALGQLYAAGVLLKNGADPECRDYNGRTALTFAAGNARQEVTELLLQSGVQVNAVDLFGNTALHYAYENEEFEIARLLLEHGADDSILNEDGMKPVQLVPDYK